MPVGELDRLGARIQCGSLGVPRLHPLLLIPSRPLHVHAAVAIDALGPDLAAQIFLGERWSVVGEPRIIADDEDAAAGVALAYLLGACRRCQSAANQQVINRALRSHRCLLAIPLDASALKREHRPYPSRDLPRACSTIRSVWSRPARGRGKVGLRPPSLPGAEVVRSWRTRRVDTPHRLKP